MAASGTRQRVDVFYDVGSPYSWLALETLWAYRGAWALDLRLRPALLGGVFKACGNMPPALAAPFKAPQMMKDMSRAAAQWGVPVVGAPGNFVTGFSTTKGMRFLAAAAKKYGETDPRLMALTRGVYAHTWGEAGAGKDVTLAPEALRDAARRAGLLEDADELIAASASDDGKAALREATAAAVEDGAFGFPWIVVRAPFVHPLPKLGPAAKPPAEGEPLCFFGSDRFEQMAYLLGKPWAGPRGPQAKL